MMFWSPTTFIAASLVVALFGEYDYSCVQADNSASKITDRRSRGSSVRGQEERAHRNLSPVANNACVQDKYVCDWKSATDSLKNKYTICVEDVDGNFESKCVDSNYPKSGIDTFTCGCCKTEIPTGKGSFKECLSIQRPLRPSHCHEEHFKCRIGSGKAKGVTGFSYCANVEIGKGSTRTFGISDECGNP